MKIAQLKCFKAGANKIINQASEQEEQSLDVVKDDDGFLNECITIQPTENIKNTGRSVH